MSAKERSNFREKGKRIYTELESSKLRSKRRDGGIAGESSREFQRKFALMADIGSRGISEILPRGARLVGESTVKGMKGVWQSSSRRGQWKPCHLWNF